MINLFMLKRKKTDLVGFLDIIVFNKNLITLCKIHYVKVDFLKY